ncbi:MAG: hypothetical protein LBS21_08820 [Clostridiales bacterium]|nr:hypothetical protein [Clostridiales bacterium]
MGYYTEKNIDEYLSVIVAQLNAPIEEIKHWLLATSIDGKEEEMHTLHSLLDKAQRQVNVQIQMLAAFIETKMLLNNSQHISKERTRPAEQVQTQVMKLDENQLEQLLDAIYSLNIGPPSFPNPLDGIDFDGLTDEELPF